VTKLDITTAWKTASAMVVTHRDVLVSIAGVFFLLPSLIFAVFVPEPAVPPGTAPRAMMAILSESYGNAAPLLILITLLQIAGTLTVLIVMTDATRPTVGDAIRRGMRLTLPYLGAQIMVGLALGTGFVVLGSLAALTGVAALAATLVMLLFVAMAYLGLRVALVAPILATGEERGPIPALRRSWAITRGNVGPLALFLLLAFLLFAVIYGLVMMFVGVVLVLTTGGEVQRVLAALISSAITAGAMVYIAAMLAAVHHQLGGHDDRGLSATFE
jgi:hypothetical protein